MRIGIYPGSFDPVTLGHLDIIERAARVMDKVIVGVLQNSSKSPMFTTQERVELMQTATAHLPNVEVKAFDGLLVDFLRQEGALYVIRGLRAITDFEYELQMAQANRKLFPEMETLFIPTHAEVSFVSSTIVKDILKHGGDVSGFVPASVLGRLTELKEQK